MIVDLLGDDDNQQDAVAVGFQPQPRSGAAARRRTITISMTWWRRGVQQTPAQVQTNRRWSPLRAAFFAAAGAAYVRKETPTP